jgi:formate hydrogenlyase subunit 3/multisubunit Na+/H+ antiporter MnhD subunit
MSTNNNNTVISYLLLRQSIGLLGLTLPLVLTFGAKWIGHCDEAQPSISHYYYSIMHIVFVGTLCMLGAFLITYRGTTDRKLENWVSNLAGVFAYGVAMFPTGFCGFNGEGGKACQYIQILTADDNKVPAIIGKLHFGFATLLFVCFVIFCFKIFQEPDTPTQMGYKKQRRNVIYKICGWIITASIICIAGITLYNHLNKTDIWPDYIYWFETTSLIPFGTSWLLKGTVNWPHSKYAPVRKAIQYLR